MINNGVFCEYQGMKAMPLVLHENVILMGRQLPFMYPFLNTNANDQMFSIVYGGDLTIHADIALEKDLLIMSLLGHVTIGGVIKARNIYILAPKGLITVAKQMDANHTLMMSSHLGIDHDEILSAPYIIANHPLKKTNGYSLIPACYGIQGGLVDGGVKKTKRIALDALQSIEGVEVTRIGGLKIIVKDAINLELVAGEMPLNQSIEIITPYDVLLPKGLVVDGQDLDITILAGGHIIVRGEDCQNAGIINYNFNHNTSGKSGCIRLNAGGFIIVEAYNTYKNKIGGGLASGIANYSLSFSQNNDYVTSHSGPIHLVAGQPITVISNSVHTLGATGINSYSFSYSQYHAHTYSSTLNIISGSDINVVSGLADKNGASGVHSFSYTINNQSKSGMVNFVAGGSVNINASYPLPEKVRVNDKEFVLVSVDIC